MEETIMLGAPSFGEVINLTDGKEFFVPFGQSKICQSIIRETQDKAVIVERLATEYLSIVLALKEMGINFCITYTEDVRIPAQMLDSFKSELKCRIVILPKNFPPQFGCYPRDMLTILSKPKIVLLNQEIGRKGIGQRGEYYFLSSLYGEGGRVLSCDNTALVTKRLIIGNARIKCDEQLTALLQKGVKIGQLPLPLGGICTSAEIKEKVFSNDHLDRVAAFLRGGNGEMHLVVDPKICTMNKNGSENWTALGPEESIEGIAECCEPLGIKVHYPYKIKVPYSVNLEQFSDGRVLMTGGDKPLAKLVGKIVGRKNVFKTKVPIKFTPVYNRAGIRCLINQIPEPMISSLVS